MLCFICAPCIQQNARVLQPTLPPRHRVRRPPCSFASFAFAAQSLLSALGVVQFISNIIFGRFVNKEKVRRMGQQRRRAGLVML